MVRKEQRQMLIVFRKKCGKETEVRHKQEELHKNEVRCNNDNINKLRKSFHYAFHVTIKLRWTLRGEKCGR